MTDAFHKSRLAAREVDNLFIKRGWMSKGLVAFPADEPNRIAVRYYSHSCQRVRIVLCDPLKLVHWLAANMERPGSLATITNLLDRKVETNTKTQP